MADWKWLIGVVIIPILIAVGFFYNADIVSVRNVGTDYSCPSSVYSSFDVMFINHGAKNTNLCVNVWSDKINFTKSSDCLYMAHDRNTETTFDLDVNISSLPENRETMENLSIYYNWNYKKNVFQSENHTIKCNYEKETYSSSLNIISEEFLK